MHIALSEMMNFQPVTNDPCLYYSSNREVILLIYVDDILIDSKYNSRINSTISELSQLCKLKNLGMQILFLEFKFKEIGTLEKRN